MPGFPVVKINPIPILSKVRNAIFTHEEVALSNFVITNAAESLTIAVAGDNGFTISAQQNLQVRTVGD